MKRRGKLLVAVAIVVVMILSFALAACDKTFEVKFETNGGSAVETMNTGVIATSPETTREGYTFSGWYTSADFADGTLVEFPYNVSSDITLYAKWTEDAGTKRPDFYSARAVLRQTVDSIIASVDKAVNQLEEDTLNMEVGINAQFDQDRYSILLASSLDPTTSKNSALIEYEKIKAFDTESETISGVKVQMVGNKLYLTKGDTKKEVPFFSNEQIMSTFFSLISGLDISVGDNDEKLSWDYIVDAYSSISPFIETIAGVMVTPEWSYNEETKEAVVSISTQNLYTGIQNLLPLLEGIIGGPLQQTVDNLIYTQLGIHYDVDIMNILSKVDLTATFNIKFDEDLRAERVEISYDLEEFDHDLNVLASLPTYDDGKRTVAYVANSKPKHISWNDSVGKIEIWITETKTATDVVENETDYTETNLINFVNAGTVTLKDSNGITASKELSYDFKANMDITKLVGFATGDVVANADNMNTAGYFHFILKDASRTYFEIIFDPKNSGTPNIFAHLEMLGTTEGTPVQMTLVYNLADLKDYLAAKNASNVQALSLANPEDATSTVNSLLKILIKLLGGTKITGQITVGTLLGGITYDYHTGLTVPMDGIGSLLHSIINLLNEEILVGEGRDTVVIRANDFTFFNADTDYKAYNNDDTKVVYVNSVGQPDTVTIGYADEFALWLNSTERDGSVNVPINFSDGTTTILPFTLDQSVLDVDTTKVGETKYTVYGWYLGQNDAFLGQALATYIEGIPFGMFKTELTVKIEEPTIENAQLNINELIDLSSSNIYSALNVTMSYEDNGTAYQNISVDNSYISIYNADNSAATLKNNMVEKIGKYIVRVSRYGVVLTKEFNVYEHNIPEYLLPDHPGFTNMFSKGGNPNTVIEGKYYYKYIDDNDEEKIVYYDNIQVTSREAAISDSNKNILVDDVIPKNYIGNYVYLHFVASAFDATSTIIRSSGAMKRVVGFSNPSENTITTRYEGGLVVPTDTEMLDLGDQNGDRRTIRIVEESGNIVVRTVAYGAELSTNITIIIKDSSGSDVTDVLYNSTTKRITNAGIHDEIYTVNFEFNTGDVSHDTTLTGDSLKGAAEEALVLSNLSVTGEYFFQYKIPQGVYWNSSVVDKWDNLLVGDNLLEGALKHEVLVNAQPETFDIQYSTGNYTLNNKALTLTLSKVLEAGGKETVSDIATVLNGLKIRSDLEIETDIIYELTISYSEKDYVKEFTIIKPRMNVSLISNPSFIPKPGQTLGGQFINGLPNEDDRISVEYTDAYGTKQTLYIVYMEKAKTGNLDYSEADMYEKKAGYVLVDANGEQFKVLNDSFASGEEYLFIDITTDIYQGGIDEEDASFTMAEDGTVVVRGSGKGRFILKCTVASRYIYELNLDAIALEQSKLFSVDENDAVLFASQLCLKVEYYDGAQSHIYYLTYISGIGYVFVTDNLNPSDTIVKDDVDESIIVTAKAVAKEGDNFTLNNGVISGSMMSEGILTFSATFDSTIVTGTAALLIYF